MYITVLVSDLKNDPWIAVQWNNSLKTLLSDNTYNAAAIRTFPKNIGDTPQGKPISVQDIVSGNTADAQVIVLVAVEALMENVSEVKEMVKSSKPVTTSSTKEVTKSGKKKAVIKKSAKKFAKKAAKKKSPVKKVAKKAAKKDNPVKKAPKKAAKKNAKKRTSPKKIVVKKKAGKKDGKKS